MFLQYTEILEGTFDSSSPSDASPYIVKLAGIMN
jgi:hypothetical protein